MKRLVRDVLDKQLVDANGDSCGKVDGIVLLDDESGRPPSVAYVESGWVTLARRFGRRPARWVAWFCRRFGPRRGAPCRVPWSNVVAVGETVKLDVDADALDLLAGERWARERVVARIPGA